MTDQTATLSPPSALPSQISAPSPGGTVVKDDVAQKAEVTEEEPYRIKCICNFTDDDGNTIYCETCDTWQHIDCFYPDNREEVSREDFAHSCADCKPRPLDRQKAIERTLRLKTSAAEGGTPLDKKTKRLPSKTTKKKPKPTDLQLNGQNGVSDGAKHGSPSDGAPPKKPKSSHRGSHSISSQHPKRSPSYGGARSNPAHPPSPATTPPDLPDDFQIHHYSEGFYSLYNEHDVPDTHNNAFASLAIPTALSRWLREPDVMRQEVGRTHEEVFQTEPSGLDEKRPKLEVKDATQSLNPETTLRWRFLKSTTSIEKDVPLIELNGEIGFQKDYCANTDNLWADLSSPLPFVFFHPVLPLYIDTRKEGSLARYVRRSCKPNAQLDTYLSGGSEYHFWLVSDRHIAENEQITLPWDFRLEKSVCARWLYLLGLSDDDTTAHDEPEPDESEYNAISNWIDRILSEYGGCACQLENNCAFARFHRHYLYVKNHGRGKKKSRKSRNQTVSPTSTGHATNSRAPSEGHGEDQGENGPGSSRSKPSSRDPTPARQGSFDQLGILTQPTDRDKRKVAMVEDSFRRMEQQHPRKKKRVSDGTSTSKSKSGHTLAMLGGSVVAGNSRSKSGSPASNASPTLSSGPFRNGTKREPSSARSRQTSVTPRPTYCDASVQTDPVEGEWFSETPKCPGPKKRIISLSQRLLNSRYRVKIEEEERRNSSVAPAIAESMDVDSTGAQATGPEAGIPAGKSVAGDVPMADIPAAETETSPTATANAKTKTPDLRVQLPPVPAFDNTGIGAQMTTTPLSASGSLVQSPFATANGLPSPFAAGVNGAASHPSPVKKKLSLSDYTRRNKSAAKSPGLLKTSISSPDGIKVEANTESQDTEKVEESISQPPVTTNGI